MHIRRRGFAAVLFFLTATAGLLAQVSSTSTLSGTVADTSGAVVPGAAGTVQNSETAASFSVVTGSNGAFSVPSLPSGTYVVKVVAAGFKESLVANIKLDV